MDIDMLSIGKRIKSRRIELQLKQTDIFNECGISSGVLSKIENGINVPSIISFYKLSRVLKCGMEWLATGTDYKNEATIFCKNEEYLLNGFRNISADDQDELIEILNLKLKRGKKKTISSKSHHSAGDEVNVV